MYSFICNTYNMYTFFLRSLPKPPKYNLLQSSVRINNLMKSYRNVAKSFSLIYLLSEES